MSKNYWLVKSEPSAYSFDDLISEEDMSAEWDGVRNYQANNNMKKMKIGDFGFFYHSVKEKQIVGIVKVIGEHRPDPTDNSNRFGMVIVEAVKEVSKYVSLAEIKANKELEEFALIRQSRLSVVPVSEKHWDIICKMANM